jgi:uncharacterized repeat protein (TIGR01451 family)
MRSLLAGTSSYLERHLKSRSRGQSLVEFALVLPLLLLLFSGAADLGRAFYGYVALENAVKEGAVYGASYPLCADATTLCPDPDNVRWRVQHEAMRVRNPDGSMITPASECRNATTGLPYADLRDCVEGDIYVVSANYSFKLLTPLISNLVGTSLSFRSESTARVVNQAFDPTPGLAPTKLVYVPATGSSTPTNAAEIRAKCTQPDPGGSPDYYRSPCMDDVTVPTGPSIKAKFRVGDTITYKFIVRNNGGTNVTNVTMADSIGWPAACGVAPTSMAVGSAPWECTYTRIAPSISGLTSDYVNTLTVDGFEILPTADSVTVEIDNIPAELKLLKFASVYKLGSDGDGVSSFGIAQTLSVGRSASVAPTIWYKVYVINQGGQTATGFNITDSNGALPYGTTDCPTKPASLAIGASYTCLYSKSFSTDGSKVNTATATATGLTTPNATNTSSVTVDVAPCTGTLKMVPMMVGLSKSAATSAWNAAGFTGAITSWSGSGGTTVITQDRQAYACMAANTTLTLTKVTTP